jgi:DNA-binding NarL/FixJ family response regulator
MPNPDNVTTVALVDDHVIVREGLREILQAEDDLDVVGEAGDSESAVRLVAKEKPHIVLLDVEIPGDDAVITVHRMRGVAPRTKVIILSVYDAPLLLEKLLAAGIKGYLLKSITRHELVAAIRGSRSDHSRVLLSVSPASLARARLQQACVLSEQELAVLRLVADALSNAQIAGRLSVTEATVKRHLRNIFTKLGAVSRIDAVNKAVAASLINAAQPQDGVLARGDSMP